jgi:hypothetical protein
LSDRVWNLTGNARKEIEVVVQNGIIEGKSAEDIQRSIKQYLREPDRLFRSVRNAQTREQELSEAARKYHPGRGNYRSSYRNAMRLARTKINAAYRKAEWTRIQNNPLVSGYRIVLNNNHTTLVKGKPEPFHDICDELQGTYPKSFLWTGWHPQCRCQMIPISISEDDFMACVQARNEDRLDEWQSTSEVKDVPLRFKEWVQNNKGRIEQAQERGTLPYCVKDNKKLVMDNLNRQQIKSDERKVYLNKMEVLLDKTVTLPTDVGNIGVGFTKRGNKHLYHDAYGLEKIGVISKEDIITLDSALAKATFVKESPLTKSRKDDILKFYYYKDADKELYYNVAEIIFKRNGLDITRRFLYALTNTI